MSLEKAASGTNLTVANHVIIVHPMVTDTLDRAIAFESQAIGRCRRFGQLHPEVHVYRLCTLNTIEVEITMQHKLSGELRRKKIREQKAKIAKKQMKVQPNSEKLLNQW
jgi:SNF2 family DNA or RNA helicase